MKALGMEKSGFPQQRAGSEDSEDREQRARPAGGQAAPGEGPGSETHVEPSLGHILATVELEPSPRQSHASLHCQGF